MTDEAFLRSKNLVTNSRTLIHSFFLLRATLYSCSSNDALKRWCSALTSSPGPLRVTWRLQTNLNAYPPWIHPTHHPTTRVFRHGKHFSPFWNAQHITILCWWSFVARCFEKLAGRMVDAMDGLTVTLTVLSSQYLRAGPSDSRKRRFGFSLGQYHRNSFVFVRDSASGNRSWSMWMDRWMDGWQLLVYGRKRA